MAFNAGTVLGRLGLDTTKFTAGLRKAGAAVKKFGGGIKAARQKMLQFEKGTGGAVTKMAAMVVGIIALQKSIRGLTNLFKDSSAAAMEYEQSVQNLATAMSLAGTKNVPAAVQGMEDYAAALQDTTKFSDTAVLSVAQTLTTMGVAQKDLKAATKATLDYSAATGRDANESAKQFGKTLSGLLGELAETFPQLKALSAEALKNGEAFDMAGQLLGGFSEAAAQTTAGRIEQMKNAFTDLRKEIGFAINDLLGPLAVAIKDILKELTASLKTPEGAAALRAGVQKAFEGIWWAIRKVVDLALRLKTVWLALRVAGAEVQAALVGQWGALQEQIGGVLQKLATALEWLAGIAAKIPAFFGGEKIAGALNDAAAAARSTGTSMAEAGAKTAGMRDAANDVVAELKKALLVSDAETRQILAGGEGLSGWKLQLSKFLNLHKTVNMETGKTGQRFRDIKTAISDSGRAAQGVLAVWSKWNKAAESAAGSTQEIAINAGNAGNAIDAAADGAGNLANELGRAADNAERAAQFDRGPGAAGGAGGGDGEDFMPNFGRGPVSRSAMDFSDPFRAVGLAEQAQATLGRISRGGKNVYIGMTGRNAARAFADAVSAEAEAAVARYTADFTATVLAELNAAGIMDAAERSRIIQERINEAQRLGVLPSTEGITTQRIS
jgi:hypothetical protein